jgi:tubulin---tyrosine ligase
MQTGTALVDRTKPGVLVEAVLSYGDSYVQPILKAALGRVFLPGTLTVLDEISCVENGFSVKGLLSSAVGRWFQISGYEAIDFDFAASHQKTFLINSYMIRKAVIRKHYLSTTIDHWVAKNASSILKSHFKRSEAFEVDYAEFLDDALVEAFDLRDSLSQNAEAVTSAQQWWILKPGMSDRGQGIKLFSTMEGLQSIFDTWEEERPDSDDGEDGEGEGEVEDEDGDYITASHLRHFVAQPYIHPPLLLEGDGRKFHVRTYVLCVGCLSVYVYKPMLALFAAKPYSPPWDSLDDVESFLTNTCLQGSPNENAVRRFWDLPLPQAQLDDIFEQMCKVTGELFEAAARAMPIHFQTLPNAFEVFGLDFLIDSAGRPYLLEVNAFPDFKQTGVDLQDIVSGFWEGVLCCAVAPFFGLEARLASRTEAEEAMVLARRVDLGR